MNSNTSGTVFQLLAFGLILAILKVVYMFFEANNIADFIVFLTAGYLLGGKVPVNKKWLGLLLCLPTLAVCVFFVKKNGFPAIMNGIGTTYAIALIVISAATLLGIYIYTKRALRKNAVKL